MPRAVHSVTPLALPLQALASGQARSRERFRVGFRRRTLRIRHPSEGSDAPAAPFAISIPTVGPRTSRTIQRSPPARVIDIISPLA